MRVFVLIGVKQVLQEKKIVVIIFYSTGGVGAKFFVCEVGRWK